MCGHSSVGGISNGCAPQPPTKSRSGAAARSAGSRRLGAGKIIVELLDLRRPVRRREVPGAIAGLVLPGGNVGAAGSHGASATAARRRRQRLPVCAAPAGKRSKAQASLHDSDHSHARSLKSAERRPHRNYEPAYRCGPAPRPRQGRSAAAHRQQCPQARGAYPRRRAGPVGWTGDQLSLDIAAMGQAVNATIDVRKPRFT